MLAHWGNRCRSSATAGLPRLVTPRFHRVQCLDRASDCAAAEYLSFSFRLVKTVEKSTRCDGTTLSTDSSWGPPKEIGGAASADGSFWYVITWSFLLPLYAVVGADFYALRRSNSYLRAGRVEQVPICTRISFYATLVLCSISSLRCFRGLEWRSWRIVLFPWIIHEFLG